MVKAIFTILGGFCVYIMGTLSYAGDRKSTRLNSSHW